MQWSGQKVLVHSTTQTGAHQWGFDGLYTQDIEEGLYICNTLPKRFLFHLEYHDSQLSEIPFMFYKFIWEYKFYLDLAEQETN